MNTTLVYTQFHVKYQVPSGVNYVSVFSNSMSRDMKGNLRGACQQPGCDCDEFVTEGSKIRCAYCEHGPAVHQLIPGATAGSATTAATASEGTDPDLEKILFDLKTLSTGETKVCCRRMVELRV